MPRYHLHVYDGVDAPDEEGIELSDLETARAVAVAGAIDLMCGLLKSEGRIALSHHIDIEDDTGAVLATVPFSDAVKIEA